MNPGTEEMLQSIHRARTVGQLVNALVNGMERSLLGYSKDAGLILARHHRAIFERLAKREACDLCGEEIYFLPLLGGEIEPYGLDGFPHLATCKVALRIDAATEGKE